MLTDNYVGEIRLLASPFLPAGWLLCQGQVLSISDHEVLYAVIGTLYGGDGATSFQLPDLRSRVVMGQGQAASGTSYSVGTALGQENVLLTANTLASHTHPFTGTVQVVTGGTGQASPENAYFGDHGVLAYTTTSPGEQPATLGPGGIRGQSGGAGGQQAHANIQPVLATNYIIATTGQYPSPSQA